MVNEGSGQFSVCFTVEGGIGTYSTRVWVHGQGSRRLPEAIREKIGPKPKGKINVTRIIRTGISTR